VIDPARAGGRGYRDRMRARAQVRGLWVVAAGLAALVLPGAPDAGTTSGEAVWTPPRVTMITDSVGGALYPGSIEEKTLARGLDLRIEIGACRKLVSPGCPSTTGVAESVLDTIAQLNAELGQLVVLYVGYNDSAEGYDQGLDSVMRELAAAGVRRVVCVTLRESQSPWPEINRQIRVAPARWPQLTVADWAPVAAPHPEWFQDNAHMTGAGALAFATWLHPLLVDACGPACVAPAATAQLLAPTVRVHVATLRWRGNEQAKSFDVGVRRLGGPWRTLAKAVGGKSLRVDGVPGTQMQARVRARDGNGVPGPWSAPRSFRL
jgi:hypothetical protein